MHPQMKTAGRTRRRGHFKSLVLAGENLLQLLLLIRIEHAPHFLVARAFQFLDLRLQLVDLRIMLGLNLVDLLLLILSQPDLAPVLGQESLDLGRWVVLLHVLFGDPARPSWHPGRQLRWIARAPLRGGRTSRLAECGLRGVE